SGESGRRSGRLVRRSRFVLPYAEGVGDASGQRTGSDAGYASHRGPGRRGSWGSGSAAGCATVRPRRRAGGGSGGLIRTAGRRGRHARRRRARRPRPPRPSRPTAAGSGVWTICKPLTNELSLPLAGNVAIRASTVNVWLVPDSPVKRT